MNVLVEVSPRTSLVQHFFMPVYLVKVLYCSMKCVWKYCNVANLRHSRILTFVTKAASNSHFLNMWVDAKQVSTVEQRVYRFHNNDCEFSFMNWPLLIY